MNAEEVLRTVQTDEFRERVMLCTGHPDYHKNEHGFFYYQDTTFSHVFEGEEASIVVPPSFLEKPPAIYSHYHPGGSVVPSPKDLYGTFMVSVGELKRDNIVYFGILVKDKDHPALLLYSYKPILTDNLEFLVQVKEGTPINIDTASAENGLDHKDPLAHMIYDLVLRDFGCFEEYAGGNFQSNNAKLARNKSLEVLPLVHYRD